MTHLPGDVLLEMAGDVARLVARAGEAEDMQGDIALMLVQSNPPTIEAAARVAALAADATRKRNQRRGLRTAAQDGARVGQTDDDDTVDRAATRILLDAAITAASTGLTFNLSRIHRL